MGRYIILNGSNRIIATRVGKAIVTGEIESETGELGQVLNEDGSFSDYTPTAEEQAEIDKQERISELRIIIPDKQLCGLDVAQEQSELKTLLGY